MKRLSRVVVVAGLLSMARSPAPGQVTISFDNSGAEGGVTVPGTTDFSFMGSNWSGGVVRTEGIFALYASGRFSYEIMAGGGTVTFDPPVASVRFFYVHGFGFAAGNATAFDAANNTLTSARTRPATSFADSNNFVAIAPAAPIARIEFSAGVIDNFTFTLAVAPSPTTTPTPTATQVPASPTATASPTLTATPASTPTAVSNPCVGDCDGNNEVTVDELITGVNIALGNAPLDECAQFDSSDDGQVTIDELTTAVNLALNGCVTG